MYSKIAKPNLCGKVGNPVFFLIMFCFGNLVMQVASWGAYLMSRDILPLSFAPRDTHEAQVQFALERGVPALIGVLASKRLPYPSRAFDMAHCSRCLIPWGQHGNFTSPYNQVDIFFYKLINICSDELIHYCTIY